MICRCWFEMFFSVEISDLLFLWERRVLKLEVKAPIFSSLLIAMKTSKVGGNQKAVERLCDLWGLKKVVCVVEQKLGTCCLWKTCPYGEVLEPRCWMCWRKAPSRSTPSPRPPIAEGAWKLAN